MLAVKALLGLALATPALSWSLTWQRYSGSVIGSAMYIDDHNSEGWGWAVQVPTKTLIPVFNKMKGKDMTVWVIGTDYVQEFIESNGGDIYDPRKQLTKEWVERWNGEFDYFFSPGQFNTTSVEEGTTVYIDTLRPSPVGDFPLALSFRKDVGIAEPFFLEQNATYNGTVRAGPHSAGNITAPDSVVNPETVAAVLNFWPVQPINLTLTAEAYGVENWAAVTARLPEIAALETSRNFTLFLPPTASITTALALSDADLLTWANAHLVQTERIGLSVAPQDFTTVAGADLSATGSWVSVGSINATIIERDILTNGGILQFVSEPLVALT